MKTQKTTRNINPNFVAITATIMLFGLLGMISNSVAGVGEWEIKADMKIQRQELSPASAVVDGKIYIFGGSDGPPAWKTYAPVEVYDPATDTWETKTDMPTPRAGLSTSVVDGVIYTIGGWWGWTTVEAYDSVANTWVMKAPMPTIRSHFSTSVVNGIIYAIGGSKGNLEGGRGYSTVEAYNPVTDTWEQKKEMPTARTGLSTSVVDGKIYAVGGSKLDWQGVPTVEVYDPATDTWEQKKEMPTARTGLSTSVVDGKIYAVGGSWLSTVEVYDPTTDAWTRALDMPTPRVFLSTGVVDGKIYAIGGQGGGPLSIVEEFDTGFRKSKSVNPAGKLSTTWGGIKVAR